MQGSQQMSACANIEIRHFMQQIYDIRIWSMDGKRKFYLSNIDICTAKIREQKNHAATF